MERSMNFDEILSHIGGFGKFQKILYVWICLPQILLAFHMLISVFTGAVPPHLCRSTNTTWPLAASSGASNFNFSLVTGPDGDPDLSCSAPGGVPGTPLAQLNHSTALALSDGHDTGGCRGRWEFSKETFQSTVATEWDLVCENANLNNIGSSIYMFGLLVGAVLFGSLADKFGRRNIILVGLAIQSTFGVGTEWTGSKHRMLAGIITDYFFGFGYITLAGLAYLIRDWRKLQLAISAPGFLFIFYIWALPKSARWLMANQRNEEAMNLIRKAALMNGKPMQEDTEICQGYKDMVKMEEREKYTVIDLVRTPRMRRNSLIMFYLWFVNVLVYYGLSLNISDFGMNIYLTQLIFGLVEMPARTITLFTLNRSRRISQLAFLAVGGLACLLTIFIPDVLRQCEVILAEHVSSVLHRQSGIGMGSMCARAGGVLAPIIYLLRGVSKNAPMVLFGLCTLLGAALTLLLPETAHQPLADTIEDVEGSSISEDSEEGNMKPALYEECPTRNPDIIN
ncbi:unnamed protein product [Coregonus sp. 'balchen']|nr:unnamed protein product [Coregonus sp. 'balchen']